jgi:ribonuclease E
VAEAAVEPEAETAVAVAVLVSDPGMIPVAETVVADPAAAAAPEPAADDPAKPKRKGWWSLGR